MARSFWKVSTSNEVLIPFSNFFCSASSFSFCSSTFFRAAATRSIPDSTPRADLRTSTRIVCSLVAQIGVGFFAVEPGPTVGRLGRAVADRYAVDQRGAPGIDIAVKDVAQRVSEIRGLRRNHRRPGEPREIQTRAGRRVVDVEIELVANVALGDPLVQLAVLQGQLGGVHFRSRFHRGIDRRGEIDGLSLEHRPIGVGDRLVPHRVRARDGQQPPQLVLGVAQANLGDDHALFLGGDAGLGLGDLDRSQGADLDLLAIQLEQILSPFQAEPLDSQRLTRRDHVPVRAFHRLDQNLGLPFEIGHADLVIRPGEDQLFGGHLGAESLEQGKGEVQVEPAEVGDRRDDVGAGLGTLRDGEPGGVVTTELQLLLDPDDVELVALGTRDRRGLGRRVLLFCVSILRLEPDVERGILERDVLPGDLRREARRNQIEVVGQRHAQAVAQGEAHAPSSFNFRKSPKLSSL